MNIVMTDCFIYDIDNNDDDGDGDGGGDGGSDDDDDGRRMHRLPMDFQSTNG